MRPFFFVCLASALVSLSTFGHALLLPLYMKEAGLSEAYIGLVIGTLSLSLVVGRLAAGWAIDRWGTRAFLCFGALLWGLSSPLVVTTERPGLLLLIRFIQGVSLAFFTSAAIAYVSHSASSAQRGRALSWWWMAWSSAVAIGPVLAGIALNARGYAFAFAGTGVIALLALVPSWLVPNFEPVDQQAGKQSLSLIPRPALKPGMIGVAVGFAAGGFATFLPLQGRALGMENPGFLLAVLGLGIVPAQFWLGRLSDRRSREAALIPALVIALIASLFATQAGTLLPALMLAFLAGIGTSGVSPVLTAWAVDRSPASQRASAASSSVAFREIGSFAGATAMGVMLGAAGQAGAFGLVVAVLAASLLGLLGTRGPGDAPSR